MKTSTEIGGYLEVRAPFDGVVTERNVHPGSLVGPATSAAASSLPMVRVEKISKLRLVVPVPEKYSAGMTAGEKVDFCGPAHPNQSLMGTVAWIDHYVV